MTEHEQDPMQIAKEAAYYGALVQAWVETRMERDRTIITLSAGAVGVLVSLLTTRPAISQLEFVLYFFATASFTIAIVVGTTVFEKNGEHLKAVLQDPETRDPSLARLDRITVLSFYAGLIFSMTIGLVTSAVRIERPEKTECAMTTKNEMTPHSRPEAVTPARAPETKSLEGVGQLRPGTGKPSGEATGAGTGKTAEVKE